MPHDTPRADRHATRAASPDDHADPRSITGPVIPARREGTARADEASTTLAVPSVRVRAARPDDVQAIHDMVCELARYEREAEAVEATVEDFRTALFGTHPRAFCLIAELPGGLGTWADDAADDPESDGPGPDEADRIVIGMALWFESFSTWRGRHGIWLEDLYVRPGYRRYGVGRRLLEDLARTCLARGYPRLEWNVLDWNQDALGFYRRLGAQSLDGWTVHRLSGQALRSLAEGSPLPSAEEPGSSNRG